MEEFIIFPRHIKSVDQLPKGRLKTFFQSCIIEDNKVDISALRKLHISDHHLFAQVVDEAALRGFAFHTLKKTNLLPFVGVPIDKVIHVPQEGNKYVGLNYSLLGLNNLIQRFAIENDMFFDKIPINGFVALNRSLNLDWLVAEMQEIGFSIEDYTELAENPTEERSNDEDKSMEVIEIERETINVEEVKRETIRYLFAEKKYHALREYCFEKGISEVGQLTISEVDIICKEIKSNQVEIVALLNDYLTLQSDLSMKVKFDTLIPMSDRLTKQALYEIFDYDIVPNRDDVIAHLQDQYLSDTDDWYVLYQVAKKLRKLDSVVVSFSKIYAKLTSVQRDLLRLEYESWGPEQRFRFEQRGTVWNAVKKMLSYAENEQLFVALRIMLYGKLFVTEEELNKVLCTNNSLIGKVLLEVLFKNYYSNETKGYSFNIEEVLQKEVRKFFVEAPAIVEAPVVVGKPTTYEDVIDEFLDKETALQPFTNLYEKFTLFLAEKKIAPGNITSEAFAKQLIAKGCKRYGVVYTKKALTEAEVIRFLFKYYVTNRLFLGTSGWRTLVDLSKVYLDYPLAISRTQGMTLARKDEDLIQADLNAFLYFDQERFVQEGFQQVVGFLDTYLVGGNSITAGALYERFLAKLVKDGVVNGKHLTRLITKYHGDKYDVSPRGVITRIYTDEKQVESVLNTDGIVDISDEVIETVTVVDTTDIQDEPIGDGNIKENGVSPAVAEHKLVSNQFIEKDSIIELTNFLREHLAVGSPNIDIDTVPLYLKFRKQLKQDGISDLYAMEDVIRTRYANEFELSLKGRVTLKAPIPLESDTKTKDVATVIVAETPIEVVNEEINTNLEDKCESSINKSTSDVIDKELRQEQVLNQATSVQKRQFAYAHSMLEVTYFLRNYLAHDGASNKGIALQTVYLKFKRDLNKDGIKDLIELEQVLTSYYSNEFSVSHNGQITLQYIQESAATLVQEDNSKEIVYDTFVPVEGNERIAESESEYTIEESLPTNVEAIPTVTNETLYYTELDMGRYKLSAHEHEQVANFLKKQFLKGYSTAARILFEASMDSIIAPIYREHYINSNGRIMTLVKKVMNNVKGTEDFLYVSGTEIQTLDAAIEKEFPETVTYEELNQFLMELKYGASPIKRIQERLITKLYWELDADTLIKQSSLEIEEDVLQKLNEYIEVQLNGKEYLIVSELKGYRFKLPRISVRWTHHLIKSILLSTGKFELIKRKNARSNDAILLTKVESNIRGFEKLIADILTKEYEGDMKQVEIYDFLALKGILKPVENNKDKVLPSELKAGFHMKIDANGIVKLI